MHWACRGAFIHSFPVKQGRQLGRAGPWLSPLLSRPWSLGARPVSLPRSGPCGAGSSGLPIPSETEVSGLWSNWRSLGDTQHNPETSCSNRSQEGLTSPPGCSLCSNVHIHLCLFSWRRKCSCCEDAVNMLAQGHPALGFPTSAWRLWKFLLLLPLGVPLVNGSTGRMREGGRRRSRSPGLGMPSRRDSLSTGGRGSRLLLFSAAGRRA